MRTHLDDTAVVKVEQFIFTDIGNIAGDLLCTMLELTRFDLFLIRVHRSESIFTDQFFRDDNRIFIVVSIPRHKGNKDILADSKLTLVHVGAICNHLAFFNFLTYIDNRGLRKSGILIGSHILFQSIMINKDTALIFAHHIDIFSIYLFNYS